MNTMNIDTMSAGREMDALVAKKVMGYVTLRVQGGEVWSWGDGRWRLKTWSPSTDIAAAWEVVARLNTLGIHLWAVGQEDALPGWQADFGRNWQSAHQAWADTAPLAICRAALKAVEL